ncbi:hypothetical protein ASPWEDRAFT_34067 [Aspergillus wentii DTO 134E9]|uniref:Uncharacterized protein n=1 Tax=Aspergillus wentii DTO 134E9 TaxID=1073089 RepID=A0A1L9S0D7_ASPWE|nr:uncharacterized protein ASPWEDRAFT_34067 [Aspergillus wentii DTO 134E9]KAI9931350.1 hypothetical protein MW887_011014 [Aspergillus wentii]OJJ40635.1 hypothetical protein ASPWEDRAFT_34067 [Aspergillus wentii DTO 134E9]
MSLNTFVRRLATAAASPNRLCQSRPGPVASWINHSRLQVSQNIASSSIPHRSFSHTPQTASSPFRLNTTKTTTQDAPPELSPDGEPLEYYSPYKPKRQWPPDMTKLSPKHQFRLERKYRRRAALKFARPKWTKATKLVQWGVIGFIVVYAVLFMEWDERGSPFDEIRRTFFSGVKTTFSTPPPPAPMRRSDNGAQAQ